MPGRLKMPKIVVEIKWDVPDEEHWLNVFNIANSLFEVCPNTKFVVTELEPVLELEQRNKVGVYIHGKRSDQ